MFVKKIIPLFCLGVFTYSSGQERPAPVVDVITATEQTVVLKENLPARLEASREAVIIPRVSGIVEKRLFEEGSRVNAGDLLYQLDKGTFRANLSSAKANLGVAKASLGQAVASRDLQKSTVNRYAPLVKANAISKQAYDEARAGLKVQQSNIASANANIEAANAAIETANINLSYTEIAAPITGIIGKSLVSEGAFVVGSQSQMATIKQLDPMYVSITQPALTILNIKKLLESGEVKNSDNNEIELVFEDGSVYPHKARFLFLDQSVDEATGEVNLRAEVDNPNGDLLPGLYVRVRLPQAVYPNAFLVPQKAITRGQQDTLLVVEADGSFHPQVVKIVGADGNNNWIVNAGLQQGQKVIIEGTSHLRGAQKVQIREAQSK